MPSGQDRYRLGTDPRLLTAGELTESLTRLLKTSARARVLVVAEDVAPHERVLQAIEAVRAAGVTAIHLAIAAGDP